LVTDGDEIEDDEDCEDEEYEYNATFVDCTCDHESTEHGWGSCDVEGCLCEGGWEE
jgi:hypothetical protein